MTNFKGSIEYSLKIIDSKGDIILAKLLFTSTIIFALIFTIINLSHMSEAVAAAQKSKKIAKAGPGRQVRLWVRAKFLSFRR